LAQSQSKLNSDAALGFKKSDGDLNSIYRQILEEYKVDTVFISNLKKAQRLWLQFRDAQLAMRYPKRHKGDEGTVQQMCEWQYLKSLTDQRVQTLREWLDGVEEGDVCAGSVRIKESR
jgi:uncharacterized protein YecT (DUF1311 family)